MDGFIIHMLIWSRRDSGLLSETATEWARVCVAECDEGAAPVCRGRLEVISRVMQW